MNKHLNVLLIIIVCSIASPARIFFVGSNPFLSIIAFPQDVARLPGEYVFYYPSYQKLPWWGDIDEPTKRPNDTYTVTGENISQEASNSVFEHRGDIRAVSNAMGVVRKVNDKVSQYIDLTYNVNAFSNKSSGNLTNSSLTVPFDYKVTNSSHEVLASSIWAFMFRDIPAGIKIQLGFYDLATPNQDFSFTRNNTRYSTDRMVWGWSTVSCSHIFGTTGLDGDAWFQNEYSRGPIYRGDIQAGLTFSKLKFGTRLRYQYGKLAQYSWVPSSGSIADSTLSANFEGTYQKSQWARKTTDAMARVYGNYTWKKGDKYSLNTLFFLGYEAQKFRNALTENLDAEDGALEAIRSVVVEINPNVNIYPWNKYSYIDAALLIEYSYSRYNNTSKQWISGSQQDAYRASRVYIGDEYTWENFSYANEHFVDFGVDISTLYPLYGNAHRSVGLGLILFVNSKFTWMNKHYGHNNNAGSEFKFVTDNIRKNFKREVWFNTMFSINYRQGPANLNLQLTEPLLYLLQPRTRITDAKGKNILYDHEKKGNWASQQGVKAALLVAYDLPTLKAKLRKGNSTAPVSGY